MVMPLSVSDADGSIALTAYVLSITADAGFAIPDDQKARLISAPVASYACTR